MRCPFCTPWGLLTQQWGNTHHEATTRCWIGCGLCHRHAQRPSVGQGSRHGQRLRCDDRTGLRHRLRDARPFTEGRWRTRAVYAANPTWGATAQITVDCLDVSGDTAYLGGMVTKATNHYSWALGKDVIFAVKDAGEGKLAVDLISYWFDDSMGYYGCHHVGLQGYLDSWLATTSKCNDLVSGSVQVMDR